MHHRLSAPAWMPPEERLRFDALTLYAVVLLVLSVIFAGQHFSAGRPYIAMLYVYGACLDGGLIAWLRMRHDLDRVSHGILLLALADTAIATWLTGGLRLTNVTPFFMLMVASVYLLGNVGFIWAMASVFVAFGFQVLDMSGYVFPDVVPPEDRARDAMVTWAASALVVLSFLWAYERGRTLAVDRLTASEERYRTVVDAARATILVEQDGEVVLSNVPVGDATGLADLLSEGDRPLVGTPGAVVVRTAEGGWAELWSAQIPWEGGTADLHFLADISARIESEGLLEETRRRLREAQRLEALGRLAGGVAHDFNNQLTIVLACCASLAESLDPASDDYDTLQDIQTAARHAAGVTRQLLALGRRQRLVREPVDLGDFLRDMHTMLQRGMRSSLTLAIAPDLPLVEVDRAQLGQVLLNLVLNGDQAMDGVGTVEVRVTPADDSTLRLRVQDEGPGIDPAKREHIFEPFFTTRNDGTGLGLAVVHGIVKQHGGSIEVRGRSDGRSGAVFDVLLPVVEGEISLDRTSGEIAVPKGGERVLLVEDDPLVRELSLRVLGRQGYRVEAVDGAGAALERWDADEGRFDLVLSDVVLGGVDGVQLVDTLRARDPDVAVLLCSGYADQESQYSVINARGWPFLQKPWTPDMLLEAVQSALSHRPGRRPPPPSPGGRAP